MRTTITRAAEYRDLPLSMLTESTTNPRRIFEDDALKELAVTHSRSRSPVPPSSRLAKQAISRSPEWASGYC
jgi:hypothetical protein